MQTLSIKLIKDLELSEEEFIKAQDKHSQTPYFRSKLEEQENKFIKSFKPSQSKSKIKEIFLFAEELKGKLLEEEAKNLEKLDRTLANLIFQAKLDDSIFIKYGITLEELAKSMGAYVIY